MSHSPRSVITDRHELRARVLAARGAGRRVGLVPTMGALHAGHLSLVDASRAECDLTVVTIFVNPRQFAPGEDLEKYPRDLERDLERLAPHQVDIVFAPSVDEIYRPGHETYVQPGPLAGGFEGALRPTHFAGVATVVLKLFQCAPADVAFFGQKDYQQTLVVRRMVEDFDLPIEIRVCPIVREPDGLAMSSRNAYLSPAERRQASAIPQSLQCAAKLVGEGERRAEIIVARMTETLAAAGLEMQYVTLVREGTLDSVEEIDGPAVALVAAQVGKTRLIDNQILAYKSK